MTNNHRILAFVAAVFCLATACKPQQTDHLVSKDKGVLRIMQYNVYIFANDPGHSFSDIASLIQEYQADVVSVNELDSCCPRSSQFQIAALAKALGDWTYVYQRTIPKGDGAYGIGITAAPGGRLKPYKKADAQKRADNIATVDSLFSASQNTQTYVADFGNIYADGEGFVHTEGHIMPDYGCREHRSFVIAEFPEYVLVSTHLEYETEEARTGQARILNETVKRLYSGSSKPVILAGDLNAVAPDTALDVLDPDWTRLSELALSWPSKDPKVCLDYIYVFKHAAPVRLVKAHAITRASSADVTKCSDHLPIYVDIRL